MNILHMLLEPTVSELKATGIFVIHSVIFKQANDNKNNPFTRYGDYHAVRQGSSYSGSIIFGMAAAIILLIKNL